MRLDVGRRNVHLVGTRAELIELAAKICNAASGPIPTVNVKVLEHDGRYTESTRPTGVVVLDDDFRKLMCWVKDE